MNDQATARPLRRSLFFVPGGDARKLEKARGAGADTLLLDLEDSVSPAEKDAARDRVAAFLREGAFGGAEPAVRVNPPGSPWFEADLDGVTAAGAAAVMLPKSEDAARLAEVAAQLDTLEARAGRGRGTLRLLALVETARGIVDLATLASGTDRLDALCFGHADFSRDMGLAVADASGGVPFHARCALALAARAAGLAPVDTICADVRDPDAFRRDAELGRRLGFEGKLCIHPAQVPLANEAYTPAADEIDYARRVVEAAQEAEAQGLGVFTVDGKMVDAPLVEAQRTVLDRARRAGAIPGGEGDDGA